MRRLQGRRGFTVMEAMLVTMIMGLVMTMLSQLQYNAGRVLKGVRRGMDERARLFAGFRRFAADCAHLQTPAYLPPSLKPIRQTVVSGGDSSGEITFYVAEYAPAGAQEIRRITYKMDGNQLVRISQLPEPIEAVRGTTESNAMVLATGAKSLRISLWDGKEFVLSYGESGRQGLPRGMRLQFTVGGLTQTWTRGFRGELL